MLVFGGVWLMAGLETAGRLGAELTGAARALDTLGPPLASGVLIALGGWLEPTVEIAGAPEAVALRALLWCVGSAALLV